MSPNAEEPANAASPDAAKNLHYYPTARSVAASIVNASMSTSANASMDQSSLTKPSTATTTFSDLRSVSLAEPAIPPEFAPCLAQTVDPEMLVDINGRKKRLWLLTVPPSISAKELEGAKLKKNKFTSSSGTRYRVTTRMRKDHLAVVVNRSLESAAIRMRIAGSVALSEHLEVPGLQFDPIKDEKFAPIQDARQRYIPFGSNEPLVHSRQLSSQDGPGKKKKKKKSRH